jgi:hypothetical protein
VKFNNLDEKFSSDRDSEKKPNGNPRNKKLNKSNLKVQWKASPID